jgi:hypothetical protein
MCYGNIKRSSGSRKQALPMPPQPQPPVAAPVPVASINSNAAAAAAAPLADGRAFASFHHPHFIVLFLIATCKPMDPNMDLFPSLVAFEPQMAKYSNGYVQQPMDFAVDPSGFHPTNIEDWIASIGSEQNLLPVNGLVAGGTVPMFPVALSQEPAVVLAQQQQTSAVDAASSSMTKADLKRLKNTESARQSRRRKNELLAGLEVKVAELENRNKDLERDNAILKTENASYFRRIEALERQVEELHRVLMAFGASAAAKRAHASGLSEDTQSKRLKTAEVAQ